MRKFRIRELVRPKKARSFWHFTHGAIILTLNCATSYVKVPAGSRPSEGARILWTRGSDRIGTRYFLSRHVSLTPTDKAVKLTDNVLIQRSSQRVFACPGRRHPGPRWVRIGISAPLSIDSFQRSLTARLDVRYISRRVTGRSLKDRLSGGRRSRWGSDVEGNPCYHSFISIQSLVSCVWCRSNLSPPLRPRGRLWLPRHARHRVARFSVRGWLHE